MGAARERGTTGELRKDHMSTTVEVLVILALILLNGFFALAELAIVSSRKVRLQALAREGSRRAAAALALAEAPSQFLSSVQVGITLVGIFAGAFGGATLADELGAVLAGVPWLARYAGPLALGLVVTGIAYFTVVIGELVPKRVALHDPERVAMRVAPAMRVVAWLFTPLVTLLSASSELLTRLLRLPPSHEPPVTDEEVSLLFEEGISAGVFERAEKDIVDRMFRLSDRRVSAVMTPRADVVWLDAGADAETIGRILTEHPYSAFPVCEGDQDHVVGVVFTADLLARLIRHEPLDLRALARPPLLLYEGMRALAAIDRLRQANTHLAIILDEYGGTEGLLSMNDLVASLVGELSSAEPPDVVRRPDGSLLVDGFLPIDELKALLGVSRLPLEEEGYQTLAGFLITNLGRLPRLGERFPWNGFHFEVVDMDGARVDQVLITPAPAAEGDDA